jgi:hypothetical protein
MHCKDFNARVFGIHLRLPSLKLGGILIIRGGGMSLQSHDALSGKVFFVHFFIPLVINEFVDVGSEMRAFLFFSHQNFVIFFRARIFRQRPLRGKL